MIVFYPPNVFDEPMKPLKIWSFFFQKKFAEGTPRGASQCAEVMTVFACPQSWHQPTVGQNSHSTKSNYSSSLMIVHENILKILDPAGLSIDMMQMPSYFTLFYSGSVFTVLSINDLKNNSLFVQFFFRLLTLICPVIWSIIVDPLRLKRKIYVHNSSF